jgi:hypothetical protein
MASVNYQRLDIDLSIARPNLVAVTGQGVTYDGLTIIQLPVGAAVSLAFGVNRPEIPLLAQGQSFAFIDVCGNPFQSDEGLLVTNPAGAGVLIILLSVGGNQPR